MLMIEDRGDLGPSTRSRKLSRLGNDGINLNGVPIVPAKYDLRLESA